MNPLLENLQPYPFEKIAQLLQGQSPAADKKLISLAIGEPQHATPELVTSALAANLKMLKSYPATLAMPELRETIARWLERRFSLGAGSVDPNRNVAPLAGTREGIFSLARAVIDRSTNPCILMPNPFYQIYEGAAIFAEAEIYFLNTDEKTQQQLDLSTVPAEVWNRCQLIYICSPGNPSGTLMPESQQKELLGLAQKYNFVIAADECYSEIYRDENNPPQGLLQAAWKMGNREFKNCVVFHSLSKRSNSPGLRSGFVAGDAEIIQKYVRYRTYHGATLPPPIQMASIAAWSDEHHVIANRALYRSKYEKVEKILKGKCEWISPPAGFYLWPRIAVDDQEFCKRAFVEQAVSIVPGSYLSREAHGQNPGRNHVRIALVAEEAECVEAAKRLISILDGGTRVSG